MATGNFKKNKKLKKLIDHHTYLNKKVAEASRGRGTRLRARGPLGGAG